MSELLHDAAECSASIIERFLVLFTLSFLWIQSTTPYKSFVACESPSLDKVAWTIVTVEFIQAEDACSLRIHQLRRNEEET